VPQEIASAVYNKERRDEALFARLVIRAVPTIATTNGGQGGMNATFLAAVRENGGPGSDIHTAWARSQATSTRRSTANDGKCPGSNNMRARAAGAIDSPMRLTRSVDVDLSRGTGLFLICPEHLAVRVD
jgi:hypothetical protein